MFVDFAQACLFVGIECNAVAHKVAIGVFEYGGLFGREVERLFLCINRCHTLVEVGVHKDVVAVLGDERQCLFDNSVQAVVAVGFYHIEQHADHFGEQFARLFVGFDSICKCRCGSIDHNGIDFGLLLRNAFAYGGQIIGLFYLVEWRQAVGRVPLGQKRILTVIASG